MKTQPDAALPDLDRPAREFELPCRPEDGSETSLDPPAFVWLRVADAFAYEVQWSRDPSFARVDGCSGALPLTVFTPPERIGFGDWYWRFGAVAGGRLRWSRVRRFRVPERAAVLPLPPVDELARRIAHQRPRLFVTPEDVATLRARVAGGDLRSDWELLERHCRAVFGQPLIPEPAPFTAPWGSERSRQYAAIIGSTRAPMDAMEKCALAYLFSGDLAFAAEAARRLRHFLSWNPEGTTRLAYNDEPAMWIVMRGVRAYDWIHECLSEEERAAFETVLRARVAQFHGLLRRISFESNPYDSHAGRILGFLGEAALAFIHEWPEAADWLAYVVAIYRSVYPAWGGAGGGWQEGPPYWTAYMNFALHFAWGLKRQTGVDLLQLPFFQATPYYAIYTAPPYARTTPFGDGSHHPVGPDTGDVMYAFSTLLRNGHARWYADVMGRRSQGGILGVVLRDDSVAPRAPAADLSPARLFAENGLVAMHGSLGDPDDVYLLFRSSPYGSVSHGHADQNAFVLQGFGEPLAITSGYYPWWGSQHHIRWTWDTRSVNSITLDDGLAQTRRSPHAVGRIIAFSSAGCFDYACGDATAAYGAPPSGGRASAPQENLSPPLLRFHRHILHVRPGLFVIMDDLRAEEPHRYEWLLHAMVRMDVDREEQRIRIARGRARLDVHLLAPRPLAISQTDRADPPSEHDDPPLWHLKAATSPLRETRIWAVLAVRQAGDEGASPEARIEGTLLALDLDDGRVEVDFDAGHARRLDGAGGVREELRFNVPPA